MTPFGEKIRALRRDRNVSQADMAAALGVSAAYLSALEHGKRGAPPWPMVQKVIHYFGLIWDEAEALEALARLSRPKVTIDTAGLSPAATRAVNIMEARIARLSPVEIDALLAVLDPDPDVSATAPEQTAHRPDGGADTS